MFSLCQVCLYFVKMLFPVGFAVQTMCCPNNSGVSVDWIEVGLIRFDFCFSFERERVVLPDRVQDVLAYGIKWPSYVFSRGEESVCVCLHLSFREMRCESMVWWVQGLLRVCQGTGRWDLVFTDATGPVSSCVLIESILSFAAFEF